MNKSELCQIGSYPLDYDFNGNAFDYLIGMSVPPVMIAQISTQIYEQWLLKIWTYERDSNAVAWAQATFDVWIKKGP